MNVMRTIFEKGTRTGRAKMFAVGLVSTLVLMLGVATIVTLDPRLEPALAEPGDAVRASANGGQQRLVGEVFNRTELYFGSDKPGPDVTRSQFNEFVDDEVTPRFPDGLTQLTGYGRFRGSSGKIVQEKSFVLILLYPTDDKRANGEIQDLRKEYKSDFKQESVLRVDSRERVSF